MSPYVVPVSPSRPAAPAGTERPLSFAPAQPDLRLFPRRAWARAFRSAWLVLPDDDLDYGDPLGSPVLRAALADYLGRVRGVACEPEQVVVCSGFRQGVELVARALAGSGYACVGVEDPGDRYLFPVLEHEGLATTAVPVDEEGLRVDRLEASEARAVVVTPANQFPMGVVLSPGRRHRLVEWARRRDGYVLEDDCEAEFRQDRQAVGALQGVAPDRVVYFGTTWQSLAPGVRLGWFVVPSSVAGMLASIGATPATFTSAILQATFAEFLTRGELDRHLRAVRKAYARRREALLDSVRCWLPGAQATGVAAGLHVVVTLPDGIDAEALVTQAKANGIEVEGLSDYRADGGGSPAGLVLGYGSLTPSQIHDGVRRLAEIARTSSA